MRVVDKNPLYENTVFGVVPQLMVMFSMKVVHWNRMDMSLGQHRHQSRA